MTEPKQTLQIGTMELCETSPEVFYVTGGQPLIDGTVLTFLQDRARVSPKRQSRICMHDSPQAPVHEMIIAHMQGFYVRPHRHLQKAEGYIVVQGNADLLTFDDDGQITSVTSLGAPGGTAPYYLRMPTRTWHGLVVRSACVVFHEVSQGPFDPTLSQFAPWAPDGKDSAAIQAFMARIDAQILAFQSPP